MKSTTNKLISGLTIAVLALALSVGVTYVLAATYSEPPTVNSGWTPCTPTTSGCNIDAPVNVGGNLQTKLGALEVNWVSSGFAAIGLRLNGKIQINDAGPDVNTVGSVLTNTGNGIGMWAPAGSGGSSVGLDQLCKTVTTGVATTGYTPIDLVINGKNICSDANGCSYRIWQSNSSGVIDLYGNNAYLLYQDLPTASPWRDSQGNNGGINGDSTTKDMTGNWDGGYLMDDSTASGGETSPSQFTFRDNTTTRGFAVTICDL